ncbi:hypothetical protein EUGRSUZ_H02158 [Eucalyptus grandis]|uniref:Uncharacterized protein n=2 Tax=Eucalyptus grandis TaxID=71139 RepID=A0A059AZR0_EUCGR|nr:hypothetical protein EUGRSUZ_H02158 [Eucalyptus grandis]
MRMSYWVMHSKGTRGKLILYARRHHDYYSRHDIKTLQNPRLRHKFEVYSMKQSEFCGDSPCEQAFRARAQHAWEHSYLDSKNLHFQLLSSC